MSTEETGGTPNNNTLYFKKKQMGWAGDEKGAVDVVWGLLRP